MMLKLYIITSLVTLISYLLVYRLSKTLNSEYGFTKLEAVLIGIISFIPVISWVIGICSLIVLLIVVKRKVSK